MIQTHQMLFSITNLFLYLYKTKEKNTMSLSEKDKQYIYNFINKFRTDNGTYPLVPLKQLELTSDEYIQNICENGVPNLNKALPKYHKVLDVIACKNFDQFHFSVSHDQFPIYEIMNESNYTNKILASNHYIGVSRGKNCFKVGEIYEWLFTFAERI